MAKSLDARYFGGRERVGEEEVVGGSNLISSEGRAAATWFTIEQSALASV